MLALRLQEKKQSYPLFISNTLNLELSFPDVQCNENRVIHSLYSGSTMH